mmetsp:Transcript_35869/g.90369  ORF Transcript_35869/g.90369 Transcript_35869/m.90369 type:complete len:336 (-) Transcript_35869:444-1451(-)|eukprot:CAMPEP_0173469432 /NCGR_PEP_ID=MMETSP1357-20121228/77351_1 /TAXON_ID=77926 /ORGANISM="Hemiselmis rufescens, Strain PCC563" /LENGTH=335 /DNA_ID=CAMNT_0014437675 /DNA_START=2000 /DNA_END=3007 /DNA_ORIENTATION=+
MGAANIKPHKCTDQQLGKDLSGKIVIVTGGNSGIGFVCVKQFAKQGATVVLTSRNVEAGQKCADECNEEAAASGKGGKAEVMQLDLTDLKSVAAFADAFKAKYKKLDILLNNAGVMAIKDRQLSKQGYEMQFATNHIGHHHLTSLLLDTLKKSSPSRVVNVSSCASDGFMGAKAAIDWDDVNFEKRKYDPNVSYAQSKLANVLFTMELNKRFQGSGVSAASLHPGVIPTNLARHMMAGVPGFITPLMPTIFWLMGFKFITQWEGAQTSLFCCLDDSIPSNSGSYYSQVGSGQYPRFKGDKSQGWPMEHPNPEVTAENAAKLWDMTEKLVKDGLAQ